MNLIAIQPLGRKREAHRLWSESQRLNLLGFSPGTPLEIRSQSARLVTNCLYARGAGYHQWSMKMSGADSWCRSTKRRQIMLVFGSKGIACSRVGRCRRQTANVQSGGARQKAGG